MANSMPRCLAFLLYDLYLPLSEFSWILSQSLQLEESPFFLLEFFLKLQTGKYFLQEEHHAVSISKFTPFCRVTMPPGGASRLNLDFFKVAVIIVAAFIFFCYCRLCFFLCGKQSASANSNVWRDTYFAVLVCHFVRNSFREILLCATLAKKSFAKTNVRRPSEIVFLIVTRNSANKINPAVNACHINKFSNNLPAFRAFDFITHAALPPFFCFHSRSLRAFSRSI